MQGNDGNGQMVSFRTDANLSLSSTIFLFSAILDTAVLLFANLPSSISNLDFLEDPLAFTAEEDNYPLVLILSNMGGLESPGTFCGQLTLESIPSSEPEPATLEINFC